MSERRPIDRYFDRLERCLAKELGEEYHPPRYTRREALRLEAEMQALERRCRLEEEFPDFDFFEDED
jgi:hypothetical protein